MDVVLLLPLEDFFRLKKKKKKAKHVSYKFFLSTQPLSKANFILAELVLSSRSAKEGPAQFHHPKSMWTRPLSPTESAGQRCVSSASLFSSYFTRD